VAAGYFTCMNYNQDYGFQGGRLIFTVLNSDGTINAGGKGPGILSDYSRSQFAGPPGSRSAKLIRDIHAAYSWAFPMVSRGISRRMMALKRT